MGRHRFSNIPPRTVREKILTAFAYPPASEERKPPIVNACGMVPLSSRPVTMIIGADLFQEDLRIEAGLVPGPRQV